MRSLLATVSAASLLFALAACGDDDGAGAAADPAGDPSGSASSSEPPGKPAPPAGVAAPGQVRSIGLVTVMDTGKGAELCLGAVAESYPPQCSGPPITNWDWNEQRGVFERQGEVRWGSFAVVGTWDGEAFGVTEAIPAALYDPAGPPDPGPPSELPDPSREYSGDELEQITTELGSSLPAAEGGYVERGRAMVTVAYDDGTLQRYADDTYGAGVVVVIRALVDA